MLWPDAAQTRARKGSIADGADAQRFGPHTAKLLRAAKATGIDARASRDAGSYLCNYLSWRAIEAVNADNGPRLAAFIHIPPLARGGATQAQGFSAHHAGRAGRCRRSDADGNGAGWREGRRNFVGWAKRQRAHHLQSCAESMMVGTAHTRLCPPYGHSVAAVPNINPTPNNRRRSSRVFTMPGRIFAIPMKARMPRRASREGHSTMDMNRRHLIGAIRRRYGRRAGDVARRRARGAAHLHARPRRHAVWRASRQPRRSDRETAARDRRSRARASAAGAAAGRLSHRHASPAKRHATGRRARRDQTRIQRRRLDAAGRRRQQHRPDRHHLRRRRHSAAGAARAGALPRRARRPHRRLRNHRPAAATASGWSRSPATSPAISSGRSRPPRWCRSTRWA